MIKHSFLAEMIKARASGDNETWQQEAGGAKRMTMQIIAFLDKKTARPVRAIAAIYKKYFDLMQQRGWEVVSPKPNISKFNKFSLALRAYFGK